MFSFLRRAALWFGLLSLVSLSPFAATVARAQSPSPGSSAAPSVPDTTGASGSDPCAGAGRLLATLNRPTFGYSACAVPKGSIVLEEGYQNQAQSGPAAAVTASFPQGFERVGIADRLELDVIGPAYNRGRSGGALASGYSDLGLGFKYELPQRGRLTYAVDGLFQAATGTGGFGLGGPTTAANLDIAYAASPAVGFGTTIAAYASSGAARSGAISRYGYLLPSLVVTVQIPNATQFYAEVAGRTKIAPDRGGQIFTDFGVQKLLGPYLEIDAEYGIDFTPVDGSRFHYVGVGFGVRVK